MNLTVPSLIFNCNFEHSSEEELPTLIVDTFNDNDVRGHIL